MSCPHSTAIGSTPTTCSLCLTHVPRKIELFGDEVHVDGVKTGLLSDRYRSEADRRATAATRPKGPRRCSKCLKPGHRRDQCEEPEVIPE